MANMLARSCFALMILLLIAAGTVTASAKTRKVSSLDDRGKSSHVKITRISNPGNNGLVISQIFGSGGNAGSPYTHDYIELHNPTSQSILLNGLSVQYAAATGTTWQVTVLPNVTLGPGQYYLIQEAVGAGNGSPLPTPDHIAAVQIAMSGTAGKVALVNAATALTGSCPTGALIIDFVGYGATANCFEGSGPAPAPSNTTADLRNGNGCTDTDANNSDLTAAAPAPRNTATASLVCSDVTVSPGTAAFGVVNFGTTSAVQTKTVSGVYLSANIGCSVISGTEFQVSSDGSTWGSSATFTQSGGNASGTLYMRYTPQATGSVGTNVVCGSSGIIRFFGITGSSVATYYRYGTMYWERDVTVPGSYVMSFYPEAGFRLSDLGTPTVGQLIDLGIDFNYGDGLTEDVRFQVTQIIPSLDIVYGVFVKEDIGQVPPSKPIKHTYAASPTSYTASLSGGRRFPGAINFGTNDWSLKSDVVTRSGVTKSSKSVTNPVILLNDDEVSQIQIPTQAFDNFTNKFQVGTQADFFLTTSNPTGQILPPGMSLDANTGVVTWDIRDSQQPAISAGQEYYFAVRIITYDVINNVNVMSMPLEVMFKVAAPRPVVATDTATNVTATTATLNGSVNPRGTAAFGYFRYSTTDPFNCGNFGTGTSTGSQSLGSGNSPVTFTQALSPLSSNTTYYYCAFATLTPGGAIVSLGNPRQVFTTSAPITHVNISGRVTALSGRGVTNATVRISGGTLPAPVTVITGRLGNYSVANLLVNQTYTVTVNARRFTFNPSSRAYTPSSDVTNADFVAQQ